MSTIASSTWFRCGAFATLALVATTPRVAQAAAGDHPQIHDYYHQWEYDWDLDEYIYVLTIETIVDGFDDVPVNLRFESFDPSTIPLMASAQILGPGVVDQDQITDFQHYVIAIYDCDDASSEAHVYDAPNTWNPLGSDSIFSFALAVGQLRSQYFGCPDHQPPPVDPTGGPGGGGGSCDADAAPVAADIDPDSTSFFYVEIELDLGDPITAGFEYDGDQWELSELYGDAGTCQGQLDTFTDYTLDILTSASCTAAPIYTPAEQTALDDYLTEVENFCQDNQ
ncbi:MAG: hypothetical protein K0V04_01005 [Deltaproteobacteria bacterium]|nr:hypothetical protein [Deltaproteobacteria bacterium]